MKNVLIITLLVTFGLHAADNSLAIQNSTQQFNDGLTVDEFVDAIAQLPIKFTHRPVLDQLSSVGLSTLSVLVGAAFGHLAVCAVTNVLGGYDQSPLFFKPREWSKSVTVGTLVGAGLGAYPSMYASFTQSLAKKIDRKLLNTAFYFQNDAVSLKQSLDVLFVSARFPRAAAFISLEALRSHLADINDLFELLTDKPYGDQIKMLLPYVQYSLDAVIQAIITLKSDPRWFEECNAQSLSNTQATLNAQYNAQAVGGLIQLANATR